MNGGIGATTLLTYISTKTDKKLIATVKFPDKFDSIHFTLDLIDGENNKLEKSEFFATIVE